MQKFICRKLYFLFVDQELYKRTEIKSIYMRTECTVPVPGAQQSSRHTHRAHERSTADNIPQYFISLGWLAGCLSVSGLDFELMISKTGDDVLITV